MKLFTLMQKVDATIFMVSRHILAELDVESMFDGEGAASDGGALAPLKEQITEYGQGSYSLGRTAGVYIAALGMLGFFISLLWNHSNANKRAEKKEGVPALALGCLGIFAIGAILTLAQSVGSNAF